MRGLLIACLAAIAAAAAHGRTFQESFEAATSKAECTATLGRCKKHCSDKSLAASIAIIATKGKKGIEPFDEAACNEDCTDMSAECRARLDEEQGSAKEGGAAESNDRSTYEAMACVAFGQETERTVRDVNVIEKVGRNECPSRVDYFVCAFDTLAGGSRRYITARHCSALGSIAQGASRSFHVSSRVGTSNASVVCAVGGTPTEVKASWDGELMGDPLVECRGQPQNK